MAQIESRRAEELVQVRGNALWGAFGTFLWGGAPLLVTVSTFAMYTMVFDGTLTATKAFTSMALFNLLRFPLSMIPGSINRIIDVSVVVKRLGDYLNAHQKQAQKLTPDSSASLATMTIADGHYTSPTMADQAVEVSNGEFSWPEIEDENAEVENDDAEQKRKGFRLSAAQLRVSQGSLVGITGSVASGKSSLLSALANLMTVESGRVLVRGAVAYCAQQPWIQNTTLKENILFGRAYDATRFDRVLSACALQNDCQSLADGVETQIGERGTVAMLDAMSDCILGLFCDRLLALSGGVVCVGVTLSGGQKARVALARAVYIDADVYLLDDILSAVDSGVGAIIMEECIQGLLRDKTVLLATHHIQWLPVCDQIIHVSEGTIRAQGDWPHMEKHIGEELGLSTIIREAVDLDVADTNKDNSEEVKSGESKGERVTKAKVRGSPSLLFSLMLTLLLLPVSLLPVLTSLSLSHSRQRFLLLIL